MSKHRQSALLLHGLSDADQRWILARLAAEDQRILGEHLSELKSLGIPADRVLIDDATGDTVASDSTKPVQPHVAADPLHAASAAQMRALLANEPAWLVRQVLALDNWAWRPDYLAALNAAERERLRVTGETPLVAGSKVAERLRAQLVLRLAGIDLKHPGDRPVPTPQRLLSSVQQAIRRWL